MYLDKAKILYKQLIPGPTRGCTEEDVHLLEQQLGQSLPEAFREYLRWIGIETWLFVGSDWGYGQLLTPSLTECTRERLAELRSPYVLPEDALVFWLHGGASFFFIPLGAGDDPPVYAGSFESGSKLAMSHFSEALEQWIQSEGKADEKRKQQQPSKLLSNLARNKEDRVLQERLETPEGALEVAKALQEIQDKLHRQGQSQLMQVIARSKELAKQGTLLGLEAFLVRYASLPADQVVERVTFLQTVNQAA